MIQHTPRDDATEIRRQMNAVRQRMADEAVEAAADARQLADWRFYVRSFPAPVLAACALAGYFAVPRRLEVMAPDEKTLRKLAEKHRLVVEPRPVPAEKKSGLMDTVFSLAGAILLRAGAAYAGRQVGRLFEDISPAPVTEEQH